MTENKALQRRFWMAFREFILTRKSVVKPNKPLPQSWMTVTVARGAFHLAAVASFWDSVAESYDSHELRVELTIDDKDSKGLVALIESRKSELEAELGESLYWYSIPEQHKSRIYIRKSTDLTDEKSWPKEHEWLLEKLEAFQHTFSELLKQLKLLKRSG